jgi:hypothetical protein
MINYHKETQFSVRKKDHTSVKTYFIDEATNEKDKNQREHSGILE